jgi:hypothetical protein
MGAEDVGIRLAEMPRVVAQRLASRILQDQAKPGCPGLGDGVPGHGLGVRLLGLAEANGEIGNGGGGLSAEHGMTPFTEMRARAAGRTKGRSRRPGPGD